MRAHAALGLCAALCAADVAPDAPSCKADGSGTGIAEGHDLTGKVLVITGGDSGIGYETALAVATTGATVVLASYSGGAAAAANITRITGNTNVEVVAIDLSVFATIRKFASTVLAKHPAIDFLINDAGIGRCRADNPGIVCPNLTQITGDGFERVFQTNYLGHFLLTELLLPALRKSAGGRIIAVSSGGASSACSMAKLPSGCTSYDSVVKEATTPSPNSFAGGTNYGLTKYLQIYHAKEVTKREKAAGSKVRAYSMRPGLVDTPMTRKSHTPAQMRFAIPAKAGACTTTYLTVNSIPASQDGDLFYQCKPEAPPTGGVSEASQQAQLYDQSLKWVGA